MYKRTAGRGRSVRFQKIHLKLIRRMPLHCINVLWTIFSLGTALNTSFFCQSFGWSDDDTDLPISYVFSYYTTMDSNSQTIIRTIDKTSYTYAQMGQGDDLEYFEFSYDGLPTHDLQVHLHQITE
jgi:hypothetical protein